jgi:hypothetical protein
MGGRLKSAPTSAKVLADDDVAALFGLEMTETVGSTTETPAAPNPRRSVRTPEQQPKPSKNKVARNTRALAKYAKAVRQRRPRGKAPKRAKKP